MKNFFLVAIAVFCTNLLMAQSSTLTITIEGLSNQKGKVLIGLYNKAEGYSKEGTAIKGGEVSAEGNQVSYTFDKLPEGDYAVSLYHDANSDNKLNTNMVGYPKENYGFSNNVFGAFGTVPDFSDAKVNLKEGESKNIVVKLR